VYSQIIGIIIFCTV